MSLTLVVASIVLLALYGPNSPIGIIWLGLSQPHDGIHGTPEPSKVGRQETRGCLHLTN